MACYSVFRMSYNGLMEWKLSFQQGEQSDKNVIFGTLYSMQLKPDIKVRVFPLFQC